MKKLLLIALLPTLIFAHSLILNIDNNEDGTITVQGIFNTGQLASGALIRLESLIDEKTLFKKRLPDESELIITIPKEPYRVVLDGGPGHTIIKEGIPPEGGFTQELIQKSEEIQTTSNSSQQNSLSIEMLVSIEVALILLLLTIFVSIRNTNKIIQQIKENK